MSSVCNSRLLWTFTMTVKRCSIHALLTLQSHGLRFSFLNFFVCLKAVRKIQKWQHFCAHAQWWSPWRLKNAEKDFSLHNTISSPSAPAQFRFWKTTFRRGLRWSSSLVEMNKMKPAWPKCTLAKGACRGEGDQNEMKLPSFKNKNCAGYEGKEIGIRLPSKSEHVHISLCRN